MKYDADKTEEYWTRDHLNSEQYMQFLHEIATFANENGLRVVPVTKFVDGYRYIK